VVGGGTYGGTQEHWMSRRDYGMVQECVDAYDARRRPDGSLEVTIRIPRRFADLWLARLSDLRTTDAEIAAFEPPAMGGGPESF
jgi:hypothetical protein